MFSPMPVFFGPSFGFSFWGGFSSFFMTIISFSIMAAIVNYVINSEKRLSNKSQDDDDDF